MTKYTVTLVRADGTREERDVTAYSAAMAERTARTFFGRALPGDIITVFYASPEDRKVHGWEAA